MHKQDSHEHLAMFWKLNLSIYSLFLSQTHLYHKPSLHWTLYEWKSFLLLDTGPNKITIYLGFYSWLYLHIIQRRKVIVIKSYLPTEPSHWTWNTCMSRHLEMVQTEFEHIFVTGILMPKRAYFSECHLLRQNSSYLVNLRWSFQKVSAACLPSFTAPVHIPTITCQNERVFHSLSSWCRWTVDNSTARTDQAEKWEASVLKSKIS